MAKKYWDAYLRSNPLTQDDDRDCIAVVSSSNATRTNADIAERITSERSEYRAETIQNILTMRDEAVRAFIQEGDSFADTLVQISPRITGVWANEAESFDADKHKRTVDLVPTASFRSTLEDIGVKVLGTKESGARITLITDGTTGLTDGTLTIGGYITIEGEKIKIADESDEEQGVFITDSTGTVHRVSARLMVNKPKQLIALIPATVPAGAEEVCVKTKFSGSGNSTLKEIRTISYSYGCQAALSA